LCHIEEGPKEGGVTFGEKEDGKTDEGGDTASWVGDEKQTRVLRYHLLTLKPIREQ
jgi:hypothetical protein